MADISDFVAQMSQGGARPNQFRVTLNFPSAAGSGQVPAGQALEFLCRAATLPASNIQDIVVGYRGRPVHFAGERDFQPWNISVLNDNDFLIRNTLETWSNSIANYQTTNGILSPLAYTTQMYVTQLDRQDRPIKEYRFVDAYPISIGDIQLAYDQNNTIEEFGVTFVYNYFTTTDLG